MSPTSECSPALRYSSPAELPQRAVGADTLWTSAHLSLLWCGAPVLKVGPATSGQLPLRSWWLQARRSDLVGGQCTSCLPLLLRPSLVLGWHVPCKKGQKCPDRWHPRPSDSQTSMGPVSHHQVSSHLTSKGQLALAWREHVQPITLAWWCHSVLHAVDVFLCFAYSWVHVFPGNLQQSHRVGGPQTAVPKRRPTATLTVWSSIRKPKAVTGRALSQAPALVDTERRRARSSSFSAHSSNRSATEAVLIPSHNFCLPAAAPSGGWWSWPTDQHVCASTVNGLGRELKDGGRMALTNSEDEWTEDRKAERATFYKEISENLTLYVLVLVMIDILACHLLCRCASKNCTCGKFV